MNYCVFLRSAIQVCIHSLSLYYMMTVPSTSIIILQNKHSQVLFVLPTGPVVITINLINQQTQLHFNWNRCMSCQQGMITDMVLADIACGGRGKVGSVYALLMHSLPKNIVLSVSQFHCVKNICCSCESGLINVF
jgi:hypothetical protein